MYTIKSVFIDGLHNTSKKKYEFTNATYIYGPNGSGKSTILNAIQFALLGYIPGTPRTKSAIMSHANQNYINVELKLADEENNEVTIYRSITKAGTKTNEVCNVTPDIDIQKITSGLELPVFDFGEFTSLSANKQKEALTSLLPVSDNVVVSTYLKKLTSYSQDADSIISGNPYKTVKTPNDAQNCVSYFKQILTGLNSESKRLVSTIQSLIYYDDYTGNKPASEIKSEINKLKIEHSESIKRETQILSNSKIQAKIDSLRKPNGNKLEDSIKNDTEYSELLEAIALTADYDYESDCNDLNKLRDKEASIKSLISQYTSLLNSGTVCPILNTDCEQLRSNAESVRDKLKNLKDQYESIHDEYTSENTRIKEKYARQRKLMLEEQSIKDAYNKRDDLSSQLVEISETSSNKSSSAIQQEIDILTEEYSKAIANEKYQSMMSKLQNEQLSIDNKIAFTKDAIKALGENGLQSDLIKEPFEKLQNEMQNTLVADWNQKDIGVPKFIIENKSNSFNFGFERDNKFIPFQNLSSGEKCVFMTLFLAELTNMSKSELKTVIIDDLFDHLDDNKFENLVSSNMHAQLIVAGVKKIENNSPFSIIELYR